VLKYHFSKRKVIVINSCNFTKIYEQAKNYHNMEEGAVMEKLKKPLCSRLEII